MWSMYVNKYIYIFKVSQIFLKDSVMNDFFKYWYYYDELRLSIDRQIIWFFIINNLDKKKMIF